MKSSIYVKRQSFEVHEFSVISFVLITFCQPQILRNSARDVTDIFAMGRSLINLVALACELNIPTRKALDRSTALMQLDPLTSLISLTSCDHQNSSLNLRHITAN